MKVQHADWETRSPDPLNDQAWWGLYSCVKGAAEAARHQQDLLEDFKWRFSGGHCKRSSCASDAETDLYGLMREAARNAPLFIARFAEACADVRQQGVEAPSVGQINRTLSLANAGYQIEGDTVVRKMWISNTEAESAGAERLAPTSPHAAQATPRMSRRSASSTQRPPSRKQALRVFLCHSSSDKAAVKELYADLLADGYRPWLDVEQLLPGQDWEAEIKKAVRNSHVVVVCLSEASVTKTGFVQKEIRFALDVADEQPDGRIFIIPARLEDCKVPDRLSKWHWVSLFEEDGHDNLLSSLVTRASEL